MVSDQHVSRGASSDNTDHEKIHWRNLIAAFSAVCVFSFSLGEIFPLLSLNMEAQGHSPKIIGLNAAMSPVGIILAGLLVPKLAHLFGPRRVGITMAIGVALVFLAYPAWPTLWAWFPLRMVQGLCVASLFALSEAWVVGNAKGKWRGLIIGVYATCISATFGVGPAIVGWVGIEGYLPFLIGSAILLLAAVPIALVQVEPSIEEETHVSAVDFAPKAPLLLAAICVHAILDGGALSFLPVYGVRLGMTVESAAVTITALAFGNVFFQIPIGWIASKTSTEATMLGCFILVLAILITLPFAMVTIWMWPLIVLLGASSFGIYTTGLAQLAERFKGRDLMAGTSAFAFVWGLGALIGSVICGGAMNLWGPDGFPHVLIAVFVLFLFVRALHRHQQKRVEQNL